MTPVVPGRRSGSKPELRKVVVLAISQRRQQAISAEAAWALEHGVEFHLVTLSREGWTSIDPRVRVHELRHGEGAHPVHRIERLLVFKLPQAFLKRVISVLRRASRTPAGPVARPALGVAKAVDRRYKRVADAFHAKVFTRVYKVLRPYVLWRVADGQVLPEVGIEQADQVVVQDAGAITLGWHLARRYPDLDVAFTLDRSRVPPIPGPPAQPAPSTDDVPARAS